jgi:hypothetical protein
MHHSLLQQVRACMVVAICKALLCHALAAFDSALHAIESS